MPYGMPCWIQAQLSVAIYSLFMEHTPCFHELSFCARIKGNAGLDGKA